MSRFDQLLSDLKVMMSFNKDITSIEKLMSSFDQLITSFYQLMTIDYLRNALGPIHTETGLGKKIK